MNKTIFKVCKVSLFILMLPFFSEAQTVQGEKNTDGTFQKWHRIEVVLDGPNVSEASATFRNYRLDVTFTSPSAKVYKVPGFFDADGDAANSSATAGTVWKARFAGGEEGTWTYKVSFVKGPNVAAQLTGGTRGTLPDGQSGTFKIGKQDKTGKDFRAKGKLQYVGEHYLRFADGDHFIKLGAGSPEVFMGDTDFDGTMGSINHTAQVADWNTGDPTWKNGKGKGIVGTVNFLSEKGVNCHYFVSMNAAGDGRQTFPWTSATNVDIYDVSKLAQWEILFTHFDAKGLMIHFVTTENENVNYMEDNDGNGTFSNVRKIYYRELIARFGHHMAITWNVGEENNWATPANGNKPNTNAQRIEFAAWLRGLAYYKDHISLHNGPSTDASANEIFMPLLGNLDFTGPGLQYGIGANNHADVLQWYNKSHSTNQKWVVSLDEAFGDVTDKIDELRKEVIWGSILSGGQMEWYIGGKDVSYINYSIYSTQYQTMGHAANFMNTYLAKDIHKMIPNDNLTAGAANWAMADPGNIYLFYIKNGGNATVNLSAAVGKKFNVQWYNPRTGGSLITGTPAVINGGNANTALGLPPNTTTEDWVVLLKSTTTTSLEEEINTTESLFAYPNPSADGIFNLSQAANWKVYSSLGVEIKSGNGAQVNLSENPKGVYLIKLNDKMERLIME